MGEPSSGILHFVALMIFFQDNIGLSDDSDIECHAGSDNRAFEEYLRRRNDAERQARQGEIKNLKIKHVENKALVQHVSNLITVLKADKENKSSDQDAVETAVSIVMRWRLRLGESAGRLPPSPSDLAEETQRRTSLEKILRFLDILREKLNKKHPDGRWPPGAVLKALTDHVADIVSLQAKIAEKIRNLQAKDANTTTSEGLRTGFDRSLVNKTDNAGPESDDESCAASSSDDEDELPTTSATAAFGELAPSDLAGSQAFIASHPEILQDSAVNALLTQAYRAAARNKRDPKTRQYVHQAMILEYCYKPTILEPGQKIAPRGPAAFFRRIAHPDGELMRRFNRHVGLRLYRVLNLVKDTLQRPSRKGHKIQLFEPSRDARVDSVIPAVGSAERVVFDKLPRQMREALETGSQHRVNQVLGRMKVAEAKEMVARIVEVKRPCLV